MGKIRSILDNWTDIRWWRQAIYYTVVLWLIKKPASLFIRVRHGPPSNPLTDDWDNLIILDACRYDAFNELHSLPGEVESRVSLASATGEWLEKAVDDRDFHDIVYVTANPRVSRYKEQFHRIIPVWDFDWDQELKVAPPRAVAKAARVAYKNYPEKRIVVHFMQPHIPFIGNYGRSEIGIHSGTQGGRDRRLGNDDDDFEWVEPYILLERGELNRQSVVRAYYENLSEVLPIVEELLNAFTGKTVVASDHGEMFGDIGWPFPKRVYGHPPNTPAIGLLRVPWLEIETGQRKTVVAEAPPSTVNSPKEEEVKKRLQDLGYLEE